MKRTHPPSTRRKATCMEVGNADFVSLHGKDCSYNPIAFPPSMEVRCNLVGQCICPWLKIAPCIFHTSHNHVGRMDGSRTTHMYRTYGSRVTHGAVTEEQKPAIRVMVGDKCVRFMSLAVDGTAVVNNINCITDS